MRSIHKLSKFAPFPPRLFPPPVRAMLRAADRRVFIYIYTHYIHYIPGIHYIYTAVVRRRSPTTAFNVVQIPQLIIDPKHEINASFHCSVVVGTASCCCVWVQQKCITILSRLIFVVGIIRGTADHKAIAALAHALTEDRGTHDHAIYMTVRLQI